jgi:hypothetical protein
VCFVRLRSPRRADHSSRWVLPTVVRRCVWSRNLVNEGALTHWWGCRAKINKTNIERALCLVTAGVKSLNTADLKERFFFFEFDTFCRVMPKCLQSAANGVRISFIHGPIRCTFFTLFLLSLALHVSGAICAHHQEHNWIVGWLGSIFVLSGTEVCVFTYCK